jgi:hypothetical protein
MGKRYVHGGCITQQELVKLSKMASEMSRMLAARVLGCNSSKKERDEDETTRKERRGREAAKGNGSCADT